MIREAYRSAQPPLRARSILTTNARMDDPFWSLGYLTESTLGAVAAAPAVAISPMLLASPGLRAHNREVILTFIIRHLVLGIGVVARLLVFFRS